VTKVRLTPSDGCTAGCAATLKKARVRVLGGAATGDAAACGPFEAEEDGNILKSLEAVCDTRLGTKLKLIPDDEAGLESWGKITFEVTGTKIAPA
jgi:hypothetical protein